jgi:Ca2+-binding RTX toxin-like protein
LKLPPLNAANAVENIVVVGALTQTFDGIYKIAAQGDYALSSEPYLMIGTNYEATATTLRGQNSTNSVAIIIASDGDDQITGSAGSSVLYGLGGNNTLISRGTYDLIRSKTSWNANDTIHVENTQGSHILAVAMDNPNPQLVYLEKIGNDLVDKITDSSGDSYSFKVVDQYAGKPLTNLNIHAAPTSTANITSSSSGFYIGGDLTDAKISPTARAMAVGDLGQSHCSRTNHPRLALQHRGSAIQRPGHLHHGRRHLAHEPGCDERRAGLFWW